jgi:hypothetical protein
VQREAEFERRLDDLDTGLFDAIPTQTSENDRRSLLACQLALRSLSSPYRYLEIGSYLGGSIQPHLMDPACETVYSIDKRPSTVPDNSGVRLRYPNNSAGRMLDILGAVDGDRGKITCLTGDSESLDPAQTGPDGVDICFIDGEHSDRMIVSDFEFCRAALRGPGVIVFHDANLVYPGLSRVIDGLRESGVDFHAYNLPSVLLVVEIGDVPLHRHPAIQALLIDNHVGYLDTLQANDHYRKWAMMPPIRFARALKARVTRSDVSP